MAGTGAFVPRRGTGQVLGTGASRAASSILAGPLAERAVQKVRHFQQPSAVIEIGAVESCPLDAHDGGDVTPLAIRHLPAPTVPPELLEQDVFGGMDVDEPVVTEVDGPS